jgi:EmrB/QacA subfamily drug resistance transporter
LICGAQFVLQLDFSIVNVALPAIQRSLGLAAAGLQWIVTGYALTFGSLLLVGGRLADLLGRRRLLMLGLTLFALASLVAGVAQSAVMLIGARIVQGSAGAFVAPAALSLLTTTFAEGPQRTRALGIWQATTAGGATTGIIVGGLLTEYLGWRAIFLVNPPLIVAMLMACRKLLPPDQITSKERIDVRGAALGTAAIAAIIFGLSHGQQDGFASSATIAALIIAVAAALGFVATERTVRAPMLPLSIFSAPTRRAAVVVMLLMGGVIAAYVYFASLYLQRVQHFSPVLTGISLVPSTATVVVTSTFVSRRLLDRIGIKRMLLLGLAFAIAGQAWLSQITATSHYAVALLPGLILTAAGLGLTFPTASVAITSGVRPGDQGLAGGLFVTGQQTGSAIGLAALAAVAASRTIHDHGSLVAGYRLSFLLAALIVLVAALTVALQLDGAACQEEIDRRRGGAQGVAVMSEPEAGLRRS